MIVLLFTSLLILLLIVVLYKKNKQNLKEDDIYFSTITENKHNIIVGYSSKVRYYYYPPFNFHDKKTEELYVDIVVKNNWIDEPFHTIFTTIIKFLSDNDDCIKSKKTLTIKIKITKTNQMADAYKVYSVKELIYITVLNVYEKIKYKYYKNDIQIILLATLLFNINLLRVMSSIYDDFENINLKKIFLDDCIEYEAVLFIIRQIKQEDKHFNFINKIFENAKKVANEFPYENSINIHELQFLQEYKPNIQKKLIDSDIFYVSSVV